MSRPEPHAAPPQWFTDALAAAYQSESAAVAVSDWLQANCAVDIGPLTTIVPRDQPPATAEPPNESDAPADSTP